MTKYLFYVVTVSLSFIFSYIAQADIVLDGTIGTATEATRINESLISTPNKGEQNAFVITPNLGAQYGSNLFYSFKEFNLQSGEIADFTVGQGAEIQNIISRVTGGSASFIDGTLRSDLVDGNLFFLNPYGVIFGENSQIELFSSFHVSTADTLMLGTDGEFNARFPEQSILSSAPPSAYGFLTNTPASIDLQSTKMISFNNNITLTGGEINIKDSLLWAVSKRIALVSLANQGIVSFNAEAGEENMDVSSTTARGNITIDDSYLLVSGANVNNETLTVNTQKAGDLYIYGGKFIVRNSLLMSGGVLDLSIDDTNPDIINNEDSGSITMQINSLKLENSFITTLTNGSGKGGNVYIFAEEFVDIGGTKKDESNNDEIRTSQISANTLSTSENAGQAGIIYVETPVLLLHDGGKLDSSSGGWGDAGGILVKADEIDINGSTMVDTDNNPYSGLFVNSTDTSENAGDAGLIAIETKNMRLTDGGQISSSTSGGGNGGVIAIAASDTLTIGNANIGNPLEDPKDIIDEVKDKPVAEHTDEGDIPSRTTTSGIFAASTNTTLETSGNAGAVMIQAKNVDMNNGFITTTTRGSGNAGTVSIIADNLYMLNGANLSSSTEGSGNGGTITLQISDTLNMQAGELQKEFAYPTVIQATSSNADIENAGQSGNIKIDAKNLTMNGSLIASSTNGTGASNLIEINADTVEISGSTILEGKMRHAGIYANSESTETNAGQAGEIHLTAQTLTLKEGGSINTSTQNADGGNIILTIPTQIYLRDGGNITTSVRGGTGNGGNITIQSPHFVIIDKGQIVAQAADGNGGNITVTTDQFLASTAAQTQVDASSKKGISGKIVITSPIVDISGNVISLPTNFLNATTQLQAKCGGLGEQLESRFIVRSLQGIGKTPRDLRTMTAYTPSKSTEVAQKTTKLPDLSGQLFVQVRCGKKTA
ncbi:filamentous hemagglutinin N-terminal domain-containing protein [Beggiatoa leptomitoformis]|uniref:Filamentous hemagglutinin N-terminal domain-containing protein n=1 Tax=Beggiatoa leptomitoformis TaxID=288004 RepID=A0A2N9YHB4_9GAMM|nr:filamentous hemagglutinin N-terminal domain-containing protein [Beggiatoa leptomitoformis]ALG67855.1 filamentous hemagglutinin N-terminal domain-containing protein [Beggiatoa leptomitoformis]AUI69887.1 filamentous hemagglutinin N-terminal domain-containing protein [Beggiatoa leptomitoformis]